MEYNIYSLLDKIRNRTSMYLFDETLMELDALLSGYEIAMREINAKSISNPPFIEFTDWLERKHNRSANSLSRWTFTVLGKYLDCNPLDVHQKKLHKNLTRQQNLNSVRLFFELLDEYRSQQDKAHL